MNPCRKTVIPRNMENMAWASQFPSFDDIFKRLMSVARCSIRPRLILLVAALSLIACRGQNSSSVESSVDSDLPGPERAKAAAERVKPLLEPLLEQKDLQYGDPVFLRAFKEEEELEVWVRHKESGKFRLLRRYPIAAMSGRLGPKLEEGDRQVPEGFYAFSKRSMKPDSTFHLAFNIGYPNAYDQHHERDGTFIMVHGNRVSIGCLAMTDPKIEEIYTLCDAALSNGQPFIRIHIFPFRMTEERMTRAIGHRWSSFWRNLKEGYDWFENNQTPPDTIVEEGRYVFQADPSN